MRKTEKDNCFHTFRNFTKLNYTFDKNNGVRYFPHFQTVNWAT